MARQKFLLIIFLMDVLENLKGYPPTHLPSRKCAVFAPKASLPSSLWGVALRIPSVSRGACQSVLPAAAQPTGPMTPRRRGRVVRFRAGSIRTRSGTPGRPQSGHPETFYDGAVPVCRTMQVRFGRPRRQTAGLVESLLKMAGLDRPVPDFPTLCRRQARIAVQIPFRGSGGPCGCGWIALVSGFAASGGFANTGLHAAGNGSRRISPGMRGRAISGRSNSHPAVRAAVRRCRNCSNRRG